MSSFDKLKDCLTTPTTWQPIATAPKDGTPILLWEDGIIGVFYWGDPKRNNIRGEAMPNTWMGALVVGKSLMPRTIDEEIFTMQGSEATHWMPLPEGPEHR